MPKESTRAFSRIVYWHVDRPRCFVITYVGDENLAGQFPHGNAKLSGRNFVRTQPHVLHEIPSSSEPATQIYSRMVNAETASSESVPPPAGAVPRNSKQVYNVLQQHRNRQRSTYNGLFNLIELSYDTDFIHHLIVQPAVEVLMYHDPILDTFKSILCEGKPTVQLSYDTTFNLGDFYLSILLFRHTDFVSKPVIPLLCLLHERKLTQTHDDFFRHVKKVNPRAELSIKRCFDD